MIIYFTPLDLERVTSSVRTSRDESNVIDCQFPATELCLSPHEACITLDLNAPVEVPGCPITLMSPWIRCEQSSLNSPTE